MTEPEPTGAGSKTVWPSLLHEVADAVLGCATPEPSSYEDPKALLVDRWALDALSAALNDMDRVTRDLLDTFNHSAAPGLEHYNHEWDLTVCEGHYLCKRMPIVHYNSANWCIDHAPPDLTT